MTDTPTPSRVHLSEVMRLAEEDPETIAVCDPAAIVRALGEALVVAREALDKYGDHRGTCPAGEPPHVVQHGPCNCGFDAALARLDSLICFDPESEAGG